MCRQRRFDIISFRFPWGSEWWICAQKNNNDEPQFFFRNSFDLMFSIGMNETMSKMEHNWICVCISSTTLLFSLQHCHSIINNYFHIQTKMSIAQYNSQVCAREMWRTHTCGPIVYLECNASKKKIRITVRNSCDLHDYFSNFSFVAFEQTFKSVGAAYRYKWMLKLISRIALIRQQTIRQSFLFIYRYILWKSLSFSLSILCLCVICHRCMQMSDVRIRDSWLTIVWLSFNACFPRQKVKIECLLSSTNPLEVDRGRSEKLLGNVCVCVRIIFDDIDDDDAGMSPRRAEFRLYCMSYCLFDEYLVGSAVIQRRHTPQTDRSKVRCYNGRYSQIPIAALKKCASNVLYAAISISSAPVAMPFQNVRPSCCRRSWPMAQTQHSQHLLDHHSLISSTSK